MVRTEKVKWDWFSLPIVVIEEVGERRETHRGGPSTLWPSRTAGASLFRMWVEGKTV